jgi:putative lipoic acid-binding regulatory protein
MPRWKLRQAKSPDTAMTSTPEPESLIAFPCDFPIKIMGETQPGFAQEVMQVVLRHAPDFDAGTMEMRKSRLGTYLSLTVTVRATSRMQLDDLYRELCDHPMVKMVL